MNLSACPKVGLKQDPASYRNYVSAQNYCYHCKEPTPIIFQHQKKYCLTENFVNCQVFKELEGCEFPEELKGSPVFFNEKSSIRKRIGFMIVAILLLLVVVFLAFSHAPLRIFKADSSLLPLPTQTASNNISPTSLIVSPTQKVASGVVPGVTAQPLNNSEATATIPVDVTATLENFSLIIHQVQEGESLVLLAQEHDTSPEAIIDINYGLPTPIWEGWTLVIPDGMEDTNQLPCFEVFFLAQSMSLDEFTAQRDCKKEELKRYNDSINGDMIQGGQWVLIPREKNS